MHDALRGLSTKQEKNLEEKKRRKIEKLTVAMIK